MMRRSRRLIADSSGFGPDECERYAANAKKIMRMVDDLSPPVRAVVHRVGATPVLRMALEGKSDQMILEAFRENG